MSSTYEDFNRVCSVCVMKSSDCVVVWKCCIVTSGDEMFVVFDEIFGVVTLSIFKYAKSVMLVGVMFFSTTGGRTTNGSVCGVCPPGEIFGGVLG